jgi:hypothetical protein
VDFRQFVFGKRSALRSRPLSQQEDRWKASSNVP